MTNRQIVLVSRPDGIPQAAHFALVESPRPVIDAGEVLVRNDVLSVDPAMRGWVSAVANYSEPVPVGGVMRSFTVGTVVESRCEEYSVGERVLGEFGWQELAAVHPAAITRRLPDTGLSPSLALGVLGLTGVTAWFGVTEVLDPAAGGTVVVSTAAGSVGSVAGQLARLRGCRTVGITGGPDKVALCLDEFGYDAAVDYRSPTFATDLAAACPDGVDSYFDNTSGAITDTVLRFINPRARIAVCGTASIDTWDPWPTGPRVERHLLTKRARMEGFLFFDFEHRLDEALDALTPLVRSGGLRYREEFLDGLEAAPDALAGLYRGENLGKRLIRL